MTIAFYHADGDNIPMSQTVPERVNAYITKGCGDPYCDDCIADGVDEPDYERVGLVTATLATTDRFNRSVGECSVCGVVKPLTSRA